MSEPPYVLRYINADNRELGLLTEHEYFIVRARLGNWGGPFARPVLDVSPSGDAAVIRYVTYEREPFIIPCVIQATADLPLWNKLDEVSEVLSPILSDDTPNRGWLYFKRIDDIHQPDEWRISVYPLPFSLQKPAEEALYYYVTEFQFMPLAAFWEDVTETSESIAGAGSWSTNTLTITPGGNVTTPPVIEVDGPSTGSISSVTITNNTLSKSIALTGLNLTTGQTLRITTGFREKDIKVGGISWYRTRSAQTEFWWLRSGDNSITITKGAASTSAARILYRKRRSGF